MDRIVNLIIPAVWIVFLIYWLVTAASAKKSAGGQSVAAVAMRAGVIVLFIAVFDLLDARARRAVFGDLLPHHPAWHVLGLVLLFAGIAVAVWARVHLGRNWGVPMSRKLEPELVTTGPYQYVRHPIYAGILLGVIGSALAGSAFWLVILAVWSMYFVCSATVEERNMLRLFPDTYPQYRKRTKMLIPFVI